MHYINLRFTYLLTCNNRHSYGTAHC